MALIEFMQPQKTEEVFVAKTGLNLGELIKVFIHML